MRRKKTHNNRGCGSDEVISVSLSDECKDRLLTELDLTLDATFKTSRSLSGSYSKLLTSNESRCECSCCFPSMDCCEWFGALVLSLHLPHSLTKKLRSKIYLYVDVKNQNVIADKVAADKSEAKKLKAMKTMNFVNDMLTKTVMATPKAIENSYGEDSKQWIRNIEPEKTTDVGKPTKKSSFWVVAELANIDLVSTIVHNWDSAFEGSFKDLTVALAGIESVGLGPLGQIFNSISDDISKDLLADIPFTVAKNLSDLLGATVFPKTVEEYNALQGRGHTGRCCHASLRGQKYYWWVHSSLIGSNKGCPAINTKFDCVSRSLFTSLVASDIKTHYAQPDECLWPNLALLEPDKTHVEDPLLQSMEGSFEGPDLNKVVGIRKMCEKNSDKEMRDLVGDSHVHCLDINATVNIIVTRNALSCANLVDKLQTSLWHAGHVLLKDPLLCAAGEAMTKRTQRQVKKWLEDRGMKITAVLASQLARTWETAALQYPGFVVQPVPYISDSGLGHDNTPKSFLSQISAVQSQVPEFSANLRWLKTYGRQHKGNWQKFRRFLKDGFLPELMRKKEPPFVLPTVTHSNFMMEGEVKRKCQHLYPKDERNGVAKANNNQAVMLTYTFQKKTCGDVVAHALLDSDKPCELVATGVSIYQDDGSSKPLCMKDIGQQCVDQMNRHHMMIPVLENTIVDTKEKLDERQAKYWPEPTEDKEIKIQQSRSKLCKAMHTECFTGGFPQYPREFEKICTEEA